MSAVIRSATLLALALSCVACQPPEPAVIAPPATDAASAPTPTPAPPQAAAALDDAAPASAKADPAGDAGIAVGLDHAGELLVGQNLKELPDRADYRAHGMLEAIGEGCEYYSGGRLPPAMSMMVQDDHIVRFNLSEETEDGPRLGQTGPFGLAPGMSRAEVLALLPGTPSITPHEYAPETGEYVTWQDPVSGLAVRLEMVDGKVEVMQWGNSEAVELIEGCA